MHWSLSVLEKRKNSGFHQGKYRFISIPFLVKEKQFILLTEEIHVIKIQQYELSN
jgi:hypothetical protein